MAHIEAAIVERRPGIHHEAVRRGHPDRQVRPGRPAVTPCRSARPPRGVTAARVMCATIPPSSAAPSRACWNPTRRSRSSPRSPTGRQAVNAVRAVRPDVVVLDIEMPVMDGMTALPLLLRADAGVRVIMASTLTTRGADIALRALRLGAADYVPKPSSIGTVSDDGFRRELLEKVKGLARQRRRVVQPSRVAGDACARPRRWPPGCWRSAVPPADRRRCSPWCRGSAAPSACQWC